MGDGAKLLLSLSLSGGLMALTLLALRPVLRRAPTLRYYLCLVALLRLAVPFSPEGSLMERAFPASETGAASVLPAAAGGELVSPQPQPVAADEGQASPEPPAGQAQAAPVIPLQAAGQETVLEARPAEVPWRLTDVLPGLWAAGALAVLLRAGVGLWRWKRRMQRNAYPARPEQTAALAALCGARRAPRLLRSPAVASPVTVGLFRPCIVLPARGYGPEELAYILRHEWTHVRRWDIAYKWLALLVGAAHWFNPLVWLLRREIDAACELSCDAAVAQALGREERAAYCRTLLHAAAPQAYPLPRVGLGGGKQDMKERMANIMTHQRASRWKKALGGLCLMAACAAGILLGCAGIPRAETSAPHTEEYQNDIALDMPQADQNEVRKILKDWVDAYRSGDPEPQFARMTETVRKGNPAGGALTGVLPGQDYTLESCRIVGNGFGESGVEAALHYQLSGPEPSLFYATEYLALTKEAGAWQVSSDVCLTYAEVSDASSLQSALEGFAMFHTDFAGTITPPPFSDEQLALAQERADAGDTRYTDRLTAGANFLHLTGGEAVESGGEVYYIWPSGDMLCMQMTQPGQQGDGGVWTVDKINVNPKAFSPAEAQALVSEGAAWQAAVTYQGICPREDDIWYRFSVQEGEETSGYEVCADNGMLRSCQDYMVTHVITKKQRPHHVHTDQLVEGKYAWEGLYYISQYEAAPTPVLVVRDESDPSRLWYQCGAEGSLYEAQISGNMAYDAQNDVTLVYYQHTPGIWIQENNALRTHAVAYPVWTSYYSRTEDMWSPQPEDVRALLQTKLSGKHAGDPAFALSGGEEVTLDGHAYYQFREQSSTTAETYVYSREMGTFSLLRGGIRYENLYGEGYSPVA